MFSARSKPEGRRDDAVPKASRSLLVLGRGIEGAKCQAAGRGVKPERRATDIKRVQVGRVTSEGRFDGEEARKAVEEGVGAKRMTALQARLAHWERSAGGWGSQFPSSRLGKGRVAASQLGAASTPLRGRRWWWWWWWWPNNQG